MYRLTRLLVIVVAICTIAGCGRPLTPEEARQVLRGVRQARQSATLEGTMATSVRLRDKLVTAQAKIRRAPGIVHLRYETGRFANWQIIEQDGMVWRVGPDGKPQTWEYGVEPGGGGLPMRPDLRVTRAGGGRVAGRPVDRYKVQAPDGGPARVEIAIDREKRYPLRISRYDSRGKLVSESVYESVNYAAAPPQTLPVPKVATARREGRQHARKHSEEELVKAFGAPLLKPTYLPPGFQLRGMFSHETRRGTPAEMRYSDGLRTLSVLQVKLPSPAERQKWQQGRERREWGERRKQGRQQGSRAEGPWRGRRGEQAQGGPPQEPRFGGGEKGKGGPGQGIWRGRLGGHVVRERRGDRMVIVTGDLEPPQLQRVMDSIPFPAGKQPTVRF